MDENLLAGRDSSGSAGASGGGTDSDGTDSDGTGSDGSDSGRTDGRGAGSDGNGSQGSAGRWEHLNWVRATDDPDPDAECIEIAAGEGDLVHLRQSDDPDNVVTTTQAKWDAFVLGVRNNEFDHFVEGVAASDAADPEGAASDAR